MIPVTSQHRAVFNHADSWAAGVLPPPLFAGGPNARDDEAQSLVIAYLGASLLCQTGGNTSGRRRPDRLPTCCFVSTIHLLCAAACAHHHQALVASSNGAASAAGPKTRLGDAVGWFKGLGQAATSMVGSGGGRAADAAEDPEYIKVCVHACVYMHACVRVCCPWALFKTLCTFLAALFVG